MYMYVYVCIYIYVCVYVCVYVCIRKRIYLYISYILCEILELYKFSIIINPASWLSHANKE